jgi:NADH-dependent fumarate reductase subunit D
MRIVIVGDGPAALSSVEAIREKDGACDITLLSPEAERACTPCFLAEHVAGTVDTGRLALKGDDFYERHHVELLSGQTVGQTVRVS